MTEVNGLVNSVQRVARGSELVTAAASGATTLFVDSAEDFDNAGGDLDVNGVRYVYTASDIEADTITLAAPGLTAAAAESDAVAPVMGGQIAIDHIAYVTMGEGDEAEVIIPFADRVAWPEGFYADPVPVVLSPDLTSIVEVPGRVPIIDGTVVRTSDEGSRVVIRELDLPDSAGVVEFYSGMDGETPGQIIGGISGGLASLDIVCPAASGDAQTPFVGMSSGSAVATDPDASRLDLSAAKINVSGELSSGGSITTTSSVHGFDIYSDGQTGTGTVGASLTNQGRLIRTPSTRRVKKDIKPLTMAESRTVLNLEPVTYRLKREEGEGTVYPGFIAEQAVEVGADLWVTRDINGNPDGFRYPEVTAALVAIVREQRDQIAALQKANTGLTGRLDALLKKLNILGL